MNYKKITIVTPSFNSVRYLEATIQSILSQNYPELEYIIIDGGSKDGTVEIIKKYEKHLAYWVSEPDQGMYYAIQKGFKKSTGEIMAWLNSDDKYHNNSLQIVNSVFNDNPDVEWIVGMPTIYNKDGLCVKVMKGRGWSKSRFWLKDYKWIQQESVFWRRSLWERSGSAINTKYRYASDLELWFRFFQYAKLYEVETVFAGFRKHGFQLSFVNEEEYNKEAVEIFKSYPPCSSDLPRIYSLKPFWKFRNILIKSKFKQASYLGLILTRLIDVFHKYPSKIMYNFDEEKWQKSS